MTDPGLVGQLEANVRLVAHGPTRVQFEEAARLAGIYWDLAVPFDADLAGLLDKLLRKVTWQEALARACAELLEGEWARAHLRDDLRYGDHLWPSQIQGIGQALYVLLEVGSVLVADATGSGKTRTGSWLLRALREQLVSMGRSISDPVLVAPPAVTDTWADELQHADVRIPTHSQGVLSSARARLPRRSSVRADRRRHVGVPADDTRERAVRRPRAGLLRGTPRPVLRPHHAHLSSPPRPPGALPSVERRWIRGALQPRGAVRRRGSVRATARGWGGVRAPW